MAKGRQARKGRPGEVTVGEVFAIVWDELRRTIGSAPTAVLLRRAIRISLVSCPELANITIKKDGRDYAYELPPESGSGSGNPEHLTAFVDDLLSLLSELTGTVLVRHLLANPTLRKLASKE